MSNNGFVEKFCVRRDRWRSQSAGPSELGGQGVKFSNLWQIRGKTCAIKINLLITPQIFRPSNGPGDLSQKLVFLRHQTLGEFMTSTYLAIRTAVQMVHLIWYLQFSSCKLQMLQTWWFIVSSYATYILKAGVSEGILNCISHILSAELWIIFYDLLPSVGLGNKNGCKGHH